MNPLLPIREPDLVELDTSTRAKFCLEEEYNKEDFKKCSDHILSQYKLQLHFGIIKDVREVDNILYQATSEGPLPILVCYKQANNGWSFFIIISDKKKQVEVFFKNSLGTTIPIQLRNKLISYFGKGTTTFFNHKEIDSDITDYGPYCLRNLKILLASINQVDQKNLQIRNMKNFSQINFAKTIDVQKDKIEVLKQFVFEVAKNETFKNKFKQLVENIPLELSSYGEEFFRNLKEQIDRGENDFDENLIEALKSKYIDKTIINKFTEECNSSSNNFGKLDLEQEFPEETFKISVILEVLLRMKSSLYFHSILQIVSDQLEIPCELLKKYFMANKEESKVNNEQTLEVNINEIINNLPEKVNINEEESISFQEVLEQTRLQVDKPLAKQQSKDFEAKFRQYERFYQDIDSEERIALTSISDWAKDIKGRLGNEDKDICKALANLARIIHSVTGGKSLRNTQIMAVFVFMLESNSKGTLCQINTGEGKTMVAALLAAILALQGKPVDIITSNPILASEAINQMGSFYKILNLNVTSATKGDNSKNVYNSDIVYGTIANFQFDYLNDLMETEKVRGNRKFSCVILDEVDSMLIDDCSNIAKVGVNFSGMESLRYVYINIWHELQKAEIKINEKIKKILEELQRKKLSIDVIDKYYKELEEINKNSQQLVKEEIMKRDLIPFELIPHHLRDYAKKKLSVWIDNAIYAKYYCYELCQYRIAVDETSGEELVMPIDYQNTGVTLKNTLWTDGLHQFIQLKHNLYLTSESLTSRFISNFGYIQKYTKIFGLTGTLGSTAEQQLFSNIYKVDYAKIPPFKPKKLKVLPMLIISDLDWIEGLIDSVRTIYENRAVLVICETEQDLNNIKTLFSEYQITVKEYANESHITIAEEPVNVGDVILATNIAGRGTDFKICSSVCEAGGLHVCVGFLPCNQRVEDQAFGRTSRQGNEGTAQLVIKVSETENLQENCADIKSARDSEEQKRLKRIEDSVIKELAVKDKLFSYFAGLYSDLTNTFSKEEEFVLYDLEEFWAFWLEEKKLKGEKLTQVEPKQQFEAFRKAARNIIKGAIEQNPYNYLKKGQYLFSNNEKDRAKQMLTNALVMNDGGTPDLLYGVHLKLFEIAMDEGGVLMKRFKNVIKELFFLRCDDNKSYKEEAAKHLQNAFVSIKKEINYLDKWLPQIHITSTIHGKNLFWIQLSSRLTCLRLHEMNLNKLTEFLKEPQDLYITGKSPTTATTLKILVKNEEEFLETELNELNSIGLNLIYTLQRVHSYDDIVIKGAQIQITSGVTVLAAALVFPPSFPFMSSLGATLISEGIMDVTLELLGQGLEPFKKKQYFKGKFISYGITIITLGIKAVLQCATVLRKAIAYCRELSSSLRASPFFSDLCMIVAENFDRIADWFELALTRAANLGQMSSKVSRTIFNHTLPLIGTKCFQSFTNRGGWNTVYNLLNSKFTEFLINNQQFLEEISSKIFKIFEYCADELEESRLKKKLISFLQNRKIYVERKIKETVMTELKKFHERKVNHNLNNEDEKFTWDDYKDIVKKIIFGVSNSLELNMAALKMARKFLKITEKVPLEKFVKYHNLLLDLLHKHRNDFKSMIPELCEKIIREIINIYFGTYL